jgi:predicted transcriptional regulator
MGIYKKILQFFSDRKSHTGLELVQAGVTMRGTTHTYLHEMVEKGWLIVVQENHPKVYSITETGLAYLTP